MRKNILLLTNIFLLFSLTACQEVSYLTPEETSVALSQIQEAQANNEETLIPSALTINCSSTKLTPRSSTTYIERDEKIVIDFVNFYFYSKIKENKKSNTENGSIESSIIEKWDYLYDGNVHVKLTKSGDEDIKIEKHEILDVFEDLNNFKPAFAGSLKKDYCPFYLGTKIFNDLLSNGGKWSELLSDKVKSYTSYVCKSRYKNTDTFHLYIEAQKNFTNALKDSITETYSVHANWDKNIITDYEKAYTIDYSTAKISVEYDYEKITVQKKAKKDYAHLKLEELSQDSQKK